MHKSYQYLPVGGDKVHGANPSICIHEQRTHRIAQFVPISDRSIHTENSFYHDILDIEWQPLHALYVPVLVLHVVSGKRGMLGDKGSGSGAKRGLPGGVRWVDPGDDHIYALNRRRIS